jgi:putative transcriptional regulator
MECILKDLRINRAWKQSELAPRLGISIAHLSLIENGKRTPSLELAFEISDFFDLSIENIWSINRFA